MRKLWNRVLCCFLVAAFFWCGTLIADRQRLREELIRFHVVANSNSEADQKVKLQVRDAVVESLQKAMTDISDLQQARAYLQENLPKIQALANSVLENAGFDCEATVTLCKEAFSTRVYDTFTLPAGIYESLRITIGVGQGKNWWCVVFPTLCVPATSRGFSDVAAGSGFPDALNHALTGEEGYELRFYLLDLLGRVENIFFQEK